MSCIIICSGEIKDYSYYEKLILDVKIIICVDGGAYHARKWGVTPDILLGDFDSINPEDLNYYKEQGVKILRFDSKKDKTDTEIAVDLAIEKHSDTDTEKYFEEIIIVGGTGSRLDHTLANIFLLKKMIDNGITGKVVNENNEIRMVKEGDYIFCKSNKIEDSFVLKNLSILSLNKESKSITTNGLCYELDNETLDFGSSRGISNEILMHEAVITVGEGLLLVIKARD
jgi:thiamine pyrophosphokinase